MTTELEYATQAYWEASQGGLKGEDLEVNMDVMQELYSQGISANLSNAACSTMMKLSDRYLRDKAERA